MPIGGGSRPERSPPADAATAWLRLVSVTDELADLEERHAQAVAARRAIDADQRAAYDAMRQAEADLEGLLAQKMAGDEPPARRHPQGSEKRLDRTREATRREWALERKAGDRVVLAVARERHAFIEQHADELLAVEREKAQAHADEMNELAHRVSEVHARLTPSEQHGVGLVHVAHPGDERLVKQPRSSSFAQAAQHLLAAGGERPPTYEPGVVVAIGEAS